MKIALRSVRSISCAGISDDAIAFVDQLKGQYEQTHLRLAGQFSSEELEKNRELNGLRTKMEQKQAQ
jgi:hypothetical protein